MRGGTQIWRFPIVIGGVSAAGLTTALVADGIADLLSVAALSIPVCVGTWLCISPRRSRGRATTSHHG
jgi:hypothetical protein